MSPEHYSSFPFNSERHSPLVDSSFDSMFFQVSAGFSVVLIKEIFRSAVVPLLNISPSLVSSLFTFEEFEITSYLNHAFFCSISLSSRSNIHHVWLSRTQRKSAYLRPKYFCSSIRFQPITRLTELCRTDKTGGVNRVGLSSSPLLLVDSELCSLYLL